MYGPLSTSEPTSGYAQGLGHNSLGLLGSISPEVHPTTSVAMSHSHSMPTFGLHVSGMPQPAYGARRGSISSATSSSCISLEQASDHSMAPGSYSPRSFTPSESPMNLPGSLSSLSGLALGTPETPSHSDLDPFTDHAAFQPEQHNALLALSHGHDEYSLSMPPPSHIRRRGAQSFDVSMLSSQHSEPNFFGHSQRINESDGSGETTPMPSSTGMFAGQPVANLSEGFRAAQMPVTPQSATSRASLGPGPCTFTPSHSYSPGSIPDHSIRGDLSNPNSPFYPSSAIALRRLTSADSVRSDSYAPHEMGSPARRLPLCSASRTSTTCLGMSQVSSPTWPSATTSRARQVSSHIDPACPTPHPACRHSPWLESPLPLPQAPCPSFVVRRHHRKPLRSPPSPRHRRHQSPRRMTVVGSVTCTLPHPPTTSCRRASTLTTVHLKCRVTVATA